MPLYEYTCPLGCTVDMFLTIKQHGTVQHCDSHSMPMEQVIGAPLMVKVEPTIAYDSPIDGRHITSWAARREDMARNNCIEYDPEMKKDAERRAQEEDQRLDASVEETIEAAIEKMPTKKRGQLYSEMTEQGFDTELVRSTKGA